MPELDDFSLSCINELELLGDKDDVLLEALKLNKDTFMEFSGAYIEKDSDGEYVVAIYDKLDWEEDEYDIVIENIGDNELFENIETDGKYHTFYFRIPCFHEVCGGLPYFRNIYNLTCLDTDDESDDDSDDDDETTDKKLEEDTTNLKIAD